jgi:hypothetical protein
MQAEISYWFTQEQLSDLPEELRRQVTICPDCREHLKNHKEVLNVLRVEQDDPGLRLGKSLWPQIQQRLKSQVAVNNHLRNRTPGRLLSAERTNVWSQRIALASITIALIAVFSGPILQFNVVDQVSQQDSFKPQYEFTRYGEAVGNPRLPIYFGNKDSVNKENELYRDVTFSGASFNQKVLSEKYQNPAVMKNDTGTSRLNENVWSLQP